MTKNEQKKVAKEVLSLLTKYNMYDFEMLEVLNLIQLIIINFIKENNKEDN